MNRVFTIPRRRPSQAECGESRSLPNSQGRLAGANSRSGQQPRTAKNSIREPAGEPQAPSHSEEAESNWIKPRRKPFERETSAQCEKWQKRNIRLLLRGSAAHRALGGKLQACTDRNPCVSEACLLCMYDFRTRLLEQSVQMLHAQKWTAASIITRNMQVALGELGSFDVKKHVRRLQKQIERSKVLRDCLIIGGLDISLNRISGRIQCWQVHLYLLIAHPKTPKLSIAVRKAFPKQLGVRFPYRFRQVVDGSRRLAIPINRFSTFGTATSTMIWNRA